MKKLIALICCILLVSIVSISCSKQENADLSGKPTIRLLTDATGIDDKSFNAAAWRGILSYYGDTWESQSGRGSAYDVITAQTQDMYIPNLKQAADEKYDLITATGFTFADSVSEVASLYPDQKFVIIDVNWLDNPNVMQFTFAEHEGSYLAGVATALQAIADNVKTPKFGFIGGVPGATITKFEVGFVQGVLSVIPEATFVDYYANDWGKPELAKAQAKNWYDNGVYAIFSAAGGTGNGTIAMAKEYRMQGKNVWAIGVDSDQYDEGVYSEGESAVLTSMLKKVEACTELALKETEEGKFEGRKIEMTVATDGVGISEKNLSGDIVSKVNAVRDEIIDGKVTIYATYAEAVAANAVPETLSAIDD